MIQREYLHQFRHTPRWGQFPIVVTALILLLPVILASRSVFAISNYSPLLVTTQTVVWTFHGLVLLRIFAVGVHTATRDYAGANWELIALTGVNATTILWAKWRAALYASRGWLLALGILRLAILPCCVAVYMLITILKPTGEWAFWTSQPDLWLVPLLSGVFTVLLTLLDVIYVALLGIVSGIITGQFSLGMVLAFFVRFLPVIGVTVLAVHEGEVTLSNVWLPWRWWITLVEGGTGALIRIPMPNLWYYALDSLIMQWVGLVLGVIVFVLWIAAAWWIGLKALGQRGALTGN